jgi:hypothetical protein
VRLQWNATRKTGAADDAAAVVGFARSLRHHVVGDLGQA